MLLNAIGRMSVDATLLSNGTVNSTDMLNAMIPLYSYYDNMDSITALMETPQSIHLIDWFIMLALHNPDTCNGFRMTVETLLHGRLPAKYDLWIILSRLSNNPLYMYETAKLIKHGMPFEFIHENMDALKDNHTVRIITDDGDTPIIDFDI